MQHTGFEQAVLDALRALNAKNQVVMTQIVMADGSMCQVFPPRGSAPGPAAVEPVQTPAIGSARDCREAIIRILHQAGRRLSTNQIIAALAAHNLLYSDRHVKGELAKLVEDGVIDNPRPGGHYLGYGFPSPESSEP